MDPLRVAIRAVCAYLVLLGLVRASGKRTVTQGSPFDFTVALVLGDLVDDAMWAEVAFSQFIAASVAVVAMHVLTEIVQLRSDKAA
jgi:uncharacterized membrane protein YcaP (DUF421 family)